MFGLLKKEIREFVKLIEEDIRNNYSSWNFYVDGVINIINNREKDITISFVLYDYNTLRLFKGFIETAVTKQECKLLISAIKHMEKIDKSQKMANAQEEIVRDFTNAKI